MPSLIVGIENDSPIEIHYEDHGSGDPVVLIHGYPLNGNSWERQERELLAKGYRVISYDRRGFGRSSQPTVGYDYDTFAADLNALLEHLDLSYIVLVGFSMGSGEVTRYLGTTDRHGCARPRCSVRSRRTCGKRRTTRTASTESLRADQGCDHHGPLRLVQGLLRQLLQHRQADARADQRAGVAGKLQRRRRGIAVCLVRLRRHVADRLPRRPAEDRRAVLVVHGTDDRILPFESTAARLPALIDDVKLVPVEGGPHNIAWTHPEEVNEALLEFIAASAPVAA